MKKLLVIAAVVMLTTVTANAQERTAGGYGAQESQDMIALKTYKALMDAAVVAFQTSITTMRTEITEIRDDLTRYHVCENLGKVYSPNADGADANGCISVVSKSADIPTCAVGKVLTSTNGSTLTCVDDQKGAAAPPPSSNKSCGNYPHGSTISYSNCENTGSRGLKSCINGSWRVTTPAQCSGKH